MGLFSKDIQTMDDLFVHTLRDIYYAENQIVKALPEMIEKATDAIRSMSQDLADEVSPRLTWIDRVSNLTREAPVQSLAIAFLLGVIVSRR